MPQLGSLQVPNQGRGRSRFSKALPAIPPIDTSVADQEPRTPPTLLPSNVSSTPSTTIAPVNLGDLPPPPPPPHNDDPKVPIQYTPLPPIPMSRRTSGTTVMSPTTPTSAPQKMKIPRRPVGGAKPQAQPTQTQTQTPTQSRAPREVIEKPTPPLPESVPQPQVLPQVQPQTQAQPQAQIPPPATLDRQKELPPQLPAFRTSVFAIDHRQAAPEPPAKAAGRQAPSPQIPMKDQQQPMTREPERERALGRVAESSLEKEQPRSDIEWQSHLFPKPPSSAAAAAPATTAANYDMKTYQEPQEQQAPPDFSPQTVEYLQPSESAQPLKSPSDSLSSILSAYSRSSTQSIIRSSDGTYSTRDSHAQESPSHHISSSTTGASSNYHEPSTSISTITPSTAVPQSRSYQPRPIANGNDLTSSPPAPPPPSKDYVSPQPSSPPARAVPTHPELGTASPPKEQIWRRRSFKGSRELPNLHLDYSHGSTASTASAGTTQSQSTVVPAYTQTQEQPAPVKPAAAPLPPPKEVNGLPGRNIRPAHLQKQSVDEPTMGHGGSRLKQLKDKFHRSRKSEDRTSSGQTTPNTGNGLQNNQPAASAANRPPTPEYQGGDIQTPHVDRITSPASPASSPEPKAGSSGQLQQKPLQTGEAPPAPPIKNDPRTVSRKQVSNISPAAPETIPGNDGTFDPKPTIPSTISPAPRPYPTGPSAAGPSTPGSSIHPAKSLPDLKTRVNPIPTTEPFPPLSTSAFPASGRNSPAPGRNSPAPGRSSPAPGGPPARGRQFEGPGTRPASRESSAHRPESRRGFDPARNSGPDASRLVRSSTGELCYRGRDGTLYPEMKERTQSPDPNAVRFPKFEGEPIPEGTILQAAPLKDSHYLCYHKHRTMLRQRNRRYPLTCQTCQKADIDDRWACSFCSLRLCESCLAIFENNKKDLTALINELAGKKTLSLSSTARPGSSLGLSTMS